MDWPARDWPALAAGQGRTLVAAVHALAMPLWVFAGAGLLVLGASRLGLVASHWDRVRAAGAWPAIAGLGLRFDLAVICAVLLPVALLVPLLPRRGRVRRALAGAVVAWCAAWLGLLVFDEFATPAFIAEFGVRPNHLYIEHLGTPGVVLETVWREAGGALVAGLLLATAAIAAAAFALRWALRPVRHAGWPVRAAWLLAVPLLVGIGARGGLDHRPLGPAQAALSVDPLVNDLALNSTYTVAHAAWNLVREADLRTPYAPIPAAEALAAVRSDLALPAGAFPDPGLPTLHALAPSGPAGLRPNLVILLEESLGARYFGSLGGQPVATRLEAWRDRSLWFDNLYASGTRSARGIEAVVTGFPPTRASSVIKLAGAQQRFFTIARALKAEGYATVFVYGGDAAFDNMARFFLNNGFDEVIDMDDLAPTAGFRTTWGVSDEDLFARVHAELSRRTQGGRPVFLLAFTTSNHTPFEFPAGRIEPWEAPADTPANAARYADWAAADYLDRAAGSGYWANSVFMLVADHDARTDGDAAVPVLGSYHIPAFITGGPVAPRRVTRLASQIDLLPTVLSVMGIAARVPATGVDLTRTDLTGPGRAIMQFHDNQAYRSGDDVVMLVPGRSPAQYRISDHELLPAPTDATLVRHAEAIAAWPVLTYLAGTYRSSPHTG